MRIEHMIELSNIELDAVAGGDAGGNTISPW